jgi:2,4-dienoyl-CoA reductase-like NADH-dependent reductase (Old Yellow Enzyme family)
MESSAYPMLFSPIKVGTTEVKNRVFMPTWPIMAM